jgi:hypothetical protein
MIVKKRLGDYRFRLSIGAVERPNYAHLLLHAGERYYLPRVFCYFDDPIGDPIGRAYYFGYPREVAAEDQQLRIEQN